MKKSTRVVKKLKKGGNLNRFPNGVTVRTNDHCATNRTVIGEFGVGYDIEIPHVEVLRPGRDDSVGDSVLRVVDSVLCLRRRRALGGEAGGEWSRKWEVAVAAAPENRR